jgi:membrane protease YdiL (CAAX protease family)
MLNKNRVVLLGSVTFGILFIFAITTLVFRAAGAAPYGNTRLSVQAITCILSLIGYLFLRAKLGGSSSRAVLPRMGWGMLGWAIVGLLFSLVPYALVLDLDAIHLENLHLKLICAAAVMAISAAILEEIFFRDMLLRWMLDRYSVRVCLIVQVIFFGGMHFFSIPFEWSALFSFTISAILLSMLWLLTGDFVAPMAAHFILNFTTGIFNGIFRRFGSYPGLLIGETSNYQFYARVGFEVVAVLIVWAVWLRRTPAIAGEQ